MREILFRGKRVDDGKWLYGDLLQYLGWAKCHIIENRFGSGGQEVIIETIGQYTGLKDKNGTKVFEGDIMKTHSNLFGVITFGTYIDDEDEAESHGWFWIGNDESGIPYKLAFSVTWSDHEVIGNIYDNPELLEAERENKH